MTDNEQHHEHALSQGYKLNEYEIVRVLGAGGFGITYLGFDDLLNQGVAIKEYLPDDLAVRKPDLSVIAKSSAAKDDYAWGLKSFMQEARTLARFQHPNIVRVSRFFEAHGTAYIVMDWVEGETLTAYLKRHGKLNESELKAILLPLLDGLEEVHKTDFLHRDIKPGNIMIRQTNRQPVLIDFGAARQLVGAKSKSVTAICTPGYAPIEQYSTKGNFGAWTDIYALGAVSYLAITGKMIDAAIDRTRHDPYISALEAGAGNASEAVLYAIDWALKVDEEDRPQSISAWRAALGEAEFATRAHPPKTIGKAERERIAELKRQIHTRDEDGVTLLHNAALLGKTETALALIKAGADVEAQTKYGNTPLHSAAWHGQTETALELIKAGAEIEAQNNSGEIPLHDAARYGQTETALALIKAGAEIEARDKNGNTPQHYAAWNGETETALALIKAGAKIDAQNKYGTTPLHFATRDGQTETALALIKAGAEIEAQDNDGRTPLHRAAWNGETETALALIKAGAEIEAQDNDGRTPLHRAARNGETETALALIKAGAEIEAQTKYGKTPLHLAARYGQIETALALIKAGAEIEAQDNRGEAPLHKAALFILQTKTALALIKAGAEIEAQTNNGNTPLHIAAENGRTETALALIKAEADVNARNSDGETPATLARKRRHINTADAIDAKTNKTSALDRWLENCRLIAWGIFFSFLTIFCLYGFIIFFRGFWDYLDDLDYKWVLGLFG